MKKHNSEDSVLLALMFSISGAVIIFSLICAGFILDKILGLI